MKHWLHIIAIPLLTGFLSTQSLLSQSTTSYTQLDSNATRTEFEQALGLYESSNISPTSSLPNSVESIWIWSQKNGDSTDIIRAMTERGRYFNAIGLKSKAISTLRFVRESPHATHLARFRATLFLRDIYFDLDAYDRAFELHQQLNWDHAPDFYQRYAPEGFLGSLYTKIGNHDKALDAYRSAIKKMKAADILIWGVIYTNSLGTVFEKMDMIDSALAYYVQADSLFRHALEPTTETHHTHRRYIHGLVLGNQGNALAIMGKYDQAIPLLEADIEASLKYEDTPDGRRNALKSLTQLSKCHVARSEVEKALLTLKRTEALIEKNDPPELWDSFFEAKANYYEYGGNDRAALDAMRSLVELRDSVQRHQREVKTQNMIIAHESIIKDREKELQDRQIHQLQQQKAEQRLTNLIFIILIVVSLIITGTVIYRFNAFSKQQRAIQLKNQEIEAQKEVIERSLSEKETLLREVNHRVKNNLQIISSLLFLQSRNTQDPVVKSSIKEAQQRVQTMSIIHQKLYQDSQFQHVEFDTYLTELIQQTISSYRMNEVEIVANIDIQYLDVTMDQAIPLSLIIHELVTNSMKHAFEGLKEGMIAVQLRRDNDHLSLRYEDDGSGLGQEEISNGNGSIGMKVIELLTQQIKGTIVLIERKPLILRIDFPID